MARFACITLRVLIGIGAVLAMGMTTMLILLIAMFDFFKDLFKVFGAVAVSFLSGFQKNPQVSPSGTDIPLPLIGLLIMFVCIFVSVCMREYKIYLHVVAAMAVVAGGWEIWRAATQPQVNILYTPLLVLWFVYYVICLKRR